MTQFKDNRLQFPLDIFWVSSPYKTGGQITLGKFQEKREHKKVKSPGKGMVIKKDLQSKSLTLKYYSKGRFIYTNIEPLEEIQVELGENINKGDVLGIVEVPHLIVRCHVNKHGRKLVINPMREMYLHKHQINRGNIPNHTPKPVPRKRV